jgi:hypothetical protein
MRRAQIGAQLEVQRIYRPVLERQRYQFGDIALALGACQAQLRRCPAAQKFVAPHDDAELHLFVMGPFGFECPLAVVE